MIYSLCCRPSYSPDASLKTAYNLINRAWGGVYRNSSGLSGLCASLSLPLSSANSSTDAAADEAKEGADLGFGDAVRFMCPACIASMRLISISGGTMHALPYSFICIAQMRSTSRYVGV